MEGLTAHLKRRNWKLLENDLSLPQIAAPNQNTAEAEA
jgi:hypothetical protein